MQINLQQIVADPKLVGDGSLGDSAAKLKKIGHDLATSVQYMTAEQLALARMILGIDSEFSTRGLFVPSDHIYGVGRDTDFLIVDERHSTIFQNPQAVTDAHKMGREIDASKEYDGLKQMARPHAFDALETGVLLVTRKSYTEKLPAIKLGQFDVPVFVFGWETAARYGRWLKEERGIEHESHTVESVDYTSRQSKQFARASWVSSLGLSSGLNGSRKDTHLDGGYVRGVSYFPVTEKATRRAK